MGSEGLEAAFQTLAEMAIEKLAARLESSERREFRQIESLLNLYAMISVRDSLPASREWTASPDLLHEYVTQIRRRQPTIVLECGSGLSTIWAGYAAELCGDGTRVVALEHDEGYLHATQELVKAHALETAVEVRHAPLENVSIAGQELVWYEPGAVDDLADIGIVLVDGPPGGSGPWARYPAMPILRPKLAAGALIIIDDADRPDESKMATRWMEEWPALRRCYLQHEKGTVLLRAPE